MRGSLYSKESFPEIGELGAWDFLAASQTKTSVERQDAIMKNGSEVARIWLALQPWTDKKLVRDFLESANNKVFKLWAEYELKKEGRHIEDWAIEMMAERGVFIWEISVLARSPKAQKHIWGHIEQAAHGQGRAEIRNMVDTAGWLCKREDLGSDVKQEMIEFVKQTLESSLLTGNVFPIQKESEEQYRPGLAKSERERREKERLTWGEKQAKMIEKIFAEAVDVLVQNEGVNSEELLQIVDICLPYGVWFVEILLQRDLDVSIKAERQILEKVWRRTFNLVKNIREDSEAEWQYGDGAGLWAAEKITISRIIGLVSFGGDDEVLNAYLKEAVEVLPDIGLAAIVNLPADCLRAVDPHIVGPGLASRDKRTWGLAIKAMNRIKAAKEGQEMQIKAAKEGQEMQIKAAKR